TLANNLLGLALGPLVIGKLSDVIGLHPAFQLMPLISIFAAAVFLYTKKHYQQDIARLTDQAILPGLESIRSCHTEEK
ncbi:MAG: multidrug DMT transporter permease, partial [Acinetobacter sp.]|nr:multidrug DMT transporter permease [Acinetobacter sp.]